jgi:hypothetical protein
MQAHGDASYPPGNSGLQLPRLVQKPSRPGASRIPDGAYETLDLLPDEHAKQRVRNNVAYIEVEPTVRWTQKLRRQRAGANYVTVSLTASSGTRIELGGVALLIEQSDKHAEYAAVRVDGMSLPGGHETPWLPYNGTRMALLDLVTLMVDDRKGTWAMWLHDSLVFAGLPLNAKDDGENVIRIRGGRTGAWVYGIVCSDENPLFDDANDNTVPDDFEKVAIGELLENGASNATVNILRRAWFEDRASREPSSFGFSGLWPDSFPAGCSPEGEPVHGMLDGLKFGAATSN